jgi:hypothetical protein
MSPISMGSLFLHIIAEWKFTPEVMVMSGDHAVTVMVGVNFLQDLN